MNENTHNSHANKPVNRYEQRERTNSSPRFDRFKRDPVTISTEPIESTFLGNAELLNKLKPQMLAIVKEIKTAINNKRRIFVKHHADCDGFCAGVALERAIIPLIEKVNDKKQAAWEKYKRMPSVTPFYNIEDVTKDIAQFLSLSGKFGEQMPLVILTDLGSGPENITPIKQLQIFGCDVIVIDHHPIDPIVDSLVKLHLNPLAIQSDTALSAGILCAELSRFMGGSIEGEDLLAAISCVGDRVEEPYAKPYFDLVEPSGYTRELLLKIAKSIDFEVFNLRGVEGRELMGILLGDDKEKQLQLVEMLSLELAERERKIVIQSQALIKTHETNRGFYAILPVDQLTLRDMYPRLGNIVGMINDRMIAEQKFSKPFVMLGTTENSITFRAQVEGGFDFPTLLKLCQDKVPEAFVEGGGHPGAGTFRFAPVHSAKVYETVFDYLKNL